MGAPKAPAIIQTPAVSAKPTADEKQAAQIALDQKKTALGKIRQDVFARSQGLRGAASMYDFAGPTPHLAGDPRSQPPDPTVKPTPVTPPAKPPLRNPWADKTTLGPVNDFAHNPFPLDQNDARGPRGDRDPQNRTLGGAPRNTGAVPGGPTANTQYGGHPQETGLYPGAATAKSPQDYYASTPTGAAQLNKVRQTLGLPAKPTTPAKPAQTVMLPNQGSIVRAKLGLTPNPNAPVTTQPALHVADSSVKPTAQYPTDNQLRVQQIFQPNKPTAPTTPAKPVTQPVAQPAKPVTQPVAQPAKPVAQPVAQPAKPVAQPPKPAATITQKPPTPAATVTQPKPGSIFTPVAKPSPTVIATLPNTLGGSKTPTPPVIKKATVNTGVSAVLSGRK